MLVFADHVSQFAATSGAIRDSNTRGRRCPHGVRAGQQTLSTQRSRIRSDSIMRTEECMDARRDVIGSSQGTMSRFFLRCLVLNCCF